MITVFVDGRSELALLPARLLPPLSSPWLGLLPGAGPRPALLPSRPFFVPVRWWTRLWGGAWPPPLVSIAGSHPSTKGPALVGSLDEWPLIFDHRDRQPHPSVIDPASLPV